MSIITAITMNMSTDSGYGILRLMQAFDSLFPAGAFTMSNGMETYTQKNIVKDRKSLSEYLESYLYAMRTNDLAFAAGAASGHDISELDEICNASKIPYELREGSRKLCVRFIKTLMQTDEYEQLKKYMGMIQTGQCSGHYCIAAGLLIADTGADIRTGLQMFCYSQLSSLVNHAVKLVPLRQGDGQAALADIARHIPEAAEYSLSVETDDLGISGSGFDLRSMQHEKLYSRIYIS
ncbi:MAG: urease accessory protein UreF [Oscillospiraceae bacterium]|nr:urease accessory protein UreF [Oscillospiraceae bacterium]